MIKIKNLFILSYNLEHVQSEDKLTFLREDKTNYISEQRMSLILEIIDKICTCTNCNVSLVMVIDLLNWIQILTRNNFDFSSDVQLSWQDENSEKYDPHLNCRIPCYHKLLSTRKPYQSILLSTPFHCIH